MRPLSRSDERGFVLLLVMLGLAFLSFVAAATLSGSRHAARLTEGRTGEIEAGLLAEAGLARATLAIDETYARDAWPENGRPVRFELGNGSVAAAIADEAGKVDIIAAPDVMIEAVLARAGLTPAHKAEILAALRSARAQAAIARRQLAPASIEELSRTIGLSAGEIAAIRPFVTVHTGLGGFDPVVAPKGLIALIPGATDVSFEADLERADAPDRPPSPAPAFTVTSPRQIFTVRAEACTASGHRAVREALIARVSRGHFARIEVREPLEMQFFAAGCDRQRLALATNH